MKKYVYVVDEKILKKGGEKDGMGSKKHLPSLR